MPNTGRLRQRMSDNVRTKGTRILLHNTTHPHSRSYSCISTRTSQETGQKNKECRVISRPLILCVCNQVKAWQQTLFHSTTAHTHVQLVSKGVRQGVWLAGVFFCWCGLTRARLTLVILDCPVSGTSAFERKVFFK